MRQLSLSKQHVIIHTKMKSRLQIKRIGLFAVRPLQVGLILKYVEKNGLRSSLIF